MINTLYVNKILNCHKLKKLLEKFLSETFKKFCTQYMSQLQETIHEKLIILVNSFRRKYSQRRALQKMIKDPKMIQNNK
jgi:hypothetical protein